MADTLRGSLLSACAGLAKGAASLQMMPRYIAIKTNEQMLRTSQAMILAVGAGLMDIITIINVVVEFMIDTYRSLLLCTIELAVRGTLEVVIEAVKTVCCANFMCYLWLTDRSLMESLPHSMLFEIAYKPILLPAIDLSSRPWSEST